MTEFSYLDNQVCFAMYSATNAMIRQYRPLLQEYDLIFLTKLPLNTLISPTERKDELSGFGVPVVKSLELLSVSTKTPETDFLIAAVVTVKAVPVGEVSEQFVVPYPTKSIIVPAVGHCDEVPKLVVAVVNTILPLLPDNANAVD